MPFAVCYNGPMVHTTTAEFRKGVSFSCLKRNGKRLSVNVGCITASVPCRSEATHRYEWNTHWTLNENGMANPTAS
jgi:hypothetical protein